MGLLGGVVGLRDDVVGRVGFAGRAAGRLGFAGLDGLLDLGFAVSIGFLRAAVGFLRAEVGLLAEDDAGFLAVGLFLLAVGFFFDGFEDLDDFFGDFFFILIFDLLYFDFLSPIVYRRYAVINSSSRPSSTACTLPVSWLVRWSLTIW